MISLTESSEPLADAGLSRRQSRLSSKRDIITGGPHGVTEFIPSQLNLKVERFKYPTLQTRGVIYGKLDKATANQVIEILEKTGWTGSDLVEYIFKIHFYQNNVGLFAFFAKIHELKLLESDNIEDLKYIRDNLKNVVPDLMQTTSEILQGMRKKPQ